MDHPHWNISVDASGSSNNESDDSHEYLVVEFPEETGDDGIPMALISSAWTFSSQKVLYCFWPSYLKSATQREKAVLNHMELAKEKCMKCPITIKYSSEKYSQALNKLKMLEDDQSSSSEAEQRLSRKKNLKSQDYLYDISVMSDYDEVPAPPKPKPATTVCAPTFPTFSNKLNKSKPDKEDHNTIGAASNPKFPNKLTKNKSEYEDLNKDTSSQKSQTCSSEDFRRGDVGSLHASGSYSSLGTRSNTSCCEKTQLLMAEMLNLITAMRNDIKYLIATSNNMGASNMGNNNYDFEPINTIADLTQLNTDLSDEETFKTWCTKLSVLGGINFSDATRKILQKLLSHSLALKMNWSGRNDKGNFKELSSVLRVIHATVRKNATSHGTTITEIDSVIKNWFRNAADRDGGRSKRQQKDKSLN